MIKSRLKKIAAITLASAMMLGMGGCGKKEAEETTTEATTATTEEPTTEAHSVEPSNPSMLDGNPDDVEISKDGKVISDLTGEWVEKDINEQRITCMMINNLKEALPQSGISHADIMYEFEVEGGITRLMAVFSDYSGLEKIGPIRSARHYYFRKALEFDAAYISFGQSYMVEHEYANFYPWGDWINGIVDGGFYRDNSRVAPHNAYTSAEGLDKQKASMNIRTTKSEDYKKMFKFNKEDTVPADGKDVSKVTFKYSDYSKPYFEYDSESGKFKRFEYGNPQIDDLDNEQLAFENIVVQLVPYVPIPDEEKLLDINMIGSGDGFYLSDGKVIPIKWSKSEEFGVTQYTTADGSELKLNPGKTFVEMFHDTNKDNIIFE